MSILSGFFKTKKYRKTDDGYKLQSEWTSSETVEMGDGNTAEENLGAIQGITSSLASTSDNYALSASAGKDLQDQITYVNDSLTECFQSVSDGKTAVATALTNQGVATASDATFVTMATNVAAVATNKYNAGVTATKVGTATAAQVLKGKTFTNASGVGLTGTMTNRGAWTGATTGSGNVTIPAGYHSGSGYVSGSGAYNAGVKAADARVNTSSASYTSGYNAGKSASAGRTVAYAAGTESVTWDSASTSTSFCATSGNTLTIKKAGAYAIVTQQARNDLLFVNGTRMSEYAPIRSFSVGDTIQLTSSESAAHYIWLCFLQ